MTKAWAVAVREFNAGVRTKAFLIGVVMLPLLMGAGFIVGQLTQNVRDTRDRKFAVLDRTPGGGLAPAIVQQAEARNENAIFDEDGKQIRPKYLLEVVPAPADDAQLPELRFALSERVRKGELQGYFEIGPNVILPKIELPTGTDATTQPTSLEQLSPRERDRLLRAQMDNLTRYATNRSTDLDPSQWFSRALSEVVIGRRAIAAGMQPERVVSLSIPVVSIPTSLVERDATGAIVEKSTPNPLAAFFVPFGMAFLLFSTVVVAATPLTHGLVEEKQQRIAEVLLASARPFDIMLGKLVGNAGVCLVLALIYLAGAYWAARQFGFGEYLTPAIIVWFVVFQVIAVLMYGALFVAVGAACTEVKEIQNLFTPIMLLLVLPLAALVNVIQNPQGPLAVLLTFIPTASPMVLMTRLTLNPPPPAWQIALAITLSLLTTLVFVWAAGRIFRVGMLVQGKGAKFSDLAKWLIRG
jgi:ABC-2 type transport system permease protein